MDRRTQISWTHHIQYTQIYFYPGGPGVEWWAWRRLGAPVFLASDRIRTRRLINFCYGRTRWTVSAAGISLWCLRFSGLVWIAMPLLRILVIIRSRFTVFWVWNSIGCIHIWQKHRHWGNLCSNHHKMSRTLLGKSYHPWSQTGQYTSRILFCHFWWPSGTDHNPHC